jgi:MFS family permease
VSVHHGLALVVIAATQLMVMLSLTIVNIALPSIQYQLHFSVTNLTWVIDAYVLGFGGILLLDAILLLSRRIAIGRIIGGGQIARRVWSRPPRSMADRLSTCPSCPSWLVILGTGHDG